MRITLVTHTHTRVRSWRRRLLVGWAVAVGLIVVPGSRPAYAANPPDAWIWQGRPNGGFLFECIRLSAAGNGGNGLIPPRSGATIALAKQGGANNCSNPLVGFNTLANFLGVHMELVNANGTFCDQRNAYNVANTSAAVTASVPLCSINTTEGQAFGSYLHPAGNVSSNGWGAPLCGLIAPAFNAAKPCQVTFKFGL
jgi:hypothetical protein